MEKVPREIVLPRLFFGKPETLPPILVALSTFPVKKYGLGLQNPVTSAKDKQNSSLRAIGELIGAVKGEQVFPTNDHIRAVKGERRDGTKYWDAANDAKVQGIISDQGAFKKAFS